MLEIVEKSIKWYGFDNTFAKYVIWILLKWVEKLFLLSNFIVWFFFGLLACGFLVCPFSFPFSPWTGTGPHVQTSSLFPDIRITFVSLWRLPSLQETFYAWSFYACVGCFNFFPTWSIFCMFSGSFSWKFHFHYLFVRMFENRCCVPLSFSNQMLVFLELSPLLSLAVVLYNFQT